MGRFLIITGIIIIAIGLLVEFGSNIPFLGRLPGDIMIKRENFTFYFPLVSGIVISIVLTVLVNLAIRFFR